MLDTALKVIKKLEDEGFKAYIVGGFVRDYMMGIESNDIDICTSATPYDINKIFSDSYLSNKDYGSVTLILSNVRLELTTFRKESDYLDNRRPNHFEFIDDIFEDLNRRDFLINTLCMNKDGEVLDLLNGKSDIDNKIIHTVGNSFIRFSEDAFRILRAIRFATVLNFELSEDIKNSILKTKHLLKKISYERKREELDKIFTSSNVLYGVKLLVQLQLDKELEIDNLVNVTSFDDLMGVWAQLDTDENAYKFTSNEKEIIMNIRNVLNLDICDKKVLYKYGLYVCSVVAEIKNIDKSLITDIYNKLPIKNTHDICINGNDIISVLERKPGKYIKNIIKDLEEKILNGILENNKDELLKYVTNEYFVI